MPILTTHNLSTGYRHGNSRSTVMSHINVSLHRGCLTALLGQNGIGKSTLLRTIAGSQPPIEGIVTLNGRDITRISRREMSQLLSMVFTDRTMAGGLTVRELVSLGRQPHTGFLGRLSRHDRQVVQQAIESVGIAHKIDSFVAQLSDGERQKMMIAKALAQETPLIILDEPTAFLDVASRIDTLQLLSRLAHSTGKAILLSTHDVSQTLLLADELWVVTGNRTLLCGVTEDVVLSGAMQSMFESEKVKFNMLKGDYEVAVPTRGTVALHCPDPELRYWLRNALTRCGIAIAAPDAPDAPEVAATKATKAPDAPTVAATITATSPNEITIGDTRVTSVAQMLATLTSHL
ncbi:MAG: ABC transporter ATP-binding protein, partial [Muribaculaceae bacterium]